MEGLLQTLKGALTVYAIIVAYTAAFTVLEMVVPAEKQQGWRRRVFNLHYLLYYQVILAFTMPALVSLVVGQLMRTYPQAFGVLDGNTWHLALFVLVYFLAYDFFYYWFHRWQHTWPLLWRQHMLHHSETALNATTAGRHHWLEEPIRVFTMTLPLAILFPGEPVVAGIGGLVIGAWVFFIHANLRLHLGPLTPVIVGPQLHRIHHSDQPQHTDKNFGAFFPIWDVLFGTYYGPAKNEFPTTGLHDGRRVDSVIEALLMPFGYRARKKS